MNDDMLPEIEDPEKRAKKSRQFNKNISKKSKQQKKKGNGKPAKKKRKKQTQSTSKYQVDEIVHAQWDQHDKHKYV